MRCAVIASTAEVWAGPAMHESMIACDHWGVAHLAEWLRELALANGLSERCAFRLELVLAEVVTNVVEHSGLLAGEAGIRVRVACRSGLLYAEVTDAGRPFDPTSAPRVNQPASLTDAAVGGLGIQLVRANVREWEYRRIDGRNRLRMILVCDD